MPYPLIIASGELQFDNPEVPYLIASTLFGKRPKTLTLQRVSNCAVGYQYVSSDDMMFEQEPMLVDVRDMVDYDILLEDRTGLAPFVTEVANGTVSCTEVFIPFMSYVRCLFDNGTYYIMIPRDRTSTQGKTAFNYNRDLFETAIQDLYNIGYRASFVDLRSACTIWGWGLIHEYMPVQVQYLKCERPFVYDCVSSLISKNRNDFAPSVEYFESLERTDGFPLMSYPIHGRNEAIAFLCACLIFKKHCSSVNTFLRPDLIRLIEIRDGKIYYPCYLPAEKQSFEYLFPQMYHSHRNKHVVEKRFEEVAVLASSHMEKGIEVYGIKMNDRYYVLSSKKIGNPTREQMESFRRDRIRNLRERALNDDTRWLDTMELEDLLRVMSLKVYDVEGTDIVEDPKVHLIPLSRLGYSGVNPDNGLLLATTDYMDTYIVDWLAMGWEFMYPMYLTYGNFAIDKTREMTQGMELTRYSYNGKIIAHVEEDSLEIDEMVTQLFTKGFFFDIFDKCYLTTTKGQELYDRIEFQEFRPILQDVSGKAIREYYGSFFA